MNLTPNDVRRKQFDKGFRGYDPTEVDLFLKQVADRLAEVAEERDRAEERTREVESKLSHYEKVELALQEALESARETARRSEASAEEKARLIVQEAELRAEKILHDAERERHGLRQDLVRLNSRQAEVAARLRGFLLSELEVLAQFQGDDPVGFLKLQPAGPVGSLPAPPARLEAPIEPPDDDGAFDDEPAPSAAPARATPPAAEPVAPPTAAAFAPEPAAQPEPTFAPVPEPEAEFDPSSFEAPPFDTPPPQEPAPESPAAEPEADPPGVAWAPLPSAHPPTPPSPLSGAYASSEDPAAPAPPSEPEDEPVSSPAVTGGWDLRSLVTGEERNVGGSEEERERIRRILDDLD